jgi:C-methyltransferase C-terminal domain/Putative zinc binding domain/Methyltransferase domain
VHPRYRQTCRVCGSTKLSPVIDLGEQYLQGSFAKPGVLKAPARKLPTTLVRCDVTRDENACGLVQLAHTFPPEILYANYWYRSGTNATMRHHLNQIAESAVRIVGQHDDLMVLDIGCNDGTLLSCYPSGTKRYGVDPSDIAREIRGDITLINTLFPSEQAMAALMKGAFSIVTSIAVFYDLEQPCEFASAVSQLLSENGIWILEMSYLPLMLLQNSFDTICHEHVEYYSLAILEFIVKRAGLRIFRAEINEINGGSIRCYVCHAANSNYGCAEERRFLHRLRIAEFDMELDTDRPYLGFQRRIEALREDLNKVLFEARARHETVHVYGASTKGNVLLQWYGINRLLVECAADRNPEKVGASTLGTAIPIVSEEQSRALKPDYYLVLPWHFRREFLEREREAIFNGTRMIFPLPTLEVVSAENFEAAKSASVHGRESMIHLLFD